MKRRGILCSNMDMHCVHSAQPSQRVMGGGCVRAKAVLKSLAGISMSHINSRCEKFEILNREQPVANRCDCFVFPIGLR